MTRNRIAGFVDWLASLPAPNDSCNQYSIDVSGGEARRQNLARYLRDISERNIHIMLLGEAPGYRGCRQTGIPFTSEQLLLDGVPELDMLGASNGYVAATPDNRWYREASATIVWGTFSQFQFLPLLWAAFPFHPHKTGNPDSNRAPRMQEIRMGVPVWQELAKVMNIERYVAIGKVAQKSLALGGIEAEKIRHPSQGGKPEFVDGIGALASQHRRTR